MLTKRQNLWEAEKMLMNNLSKRGKDIFLCLYMIRKTKQFGWKRDTVYTSRSSTNCPFPAPFNLRSSCLFMCLVPYEKCV